MHVTISDALQPEHDPRGVVLILHGGSPTSERPVDGRSLSRARARRLYSDLETPLREAGLVLALLSFTVKGWNARPGGLPSPVTDAREALAQLTEQYPGLPITLLGHSMGARVAVYVADDPAVIGVVGLAPWWQGDDPVHALAGTHLVAAHGRRDRITSAKMTRAYLQRAETCAASTKFVDMGLVGHYMLTHVKSWNSVALKESLSVAGVTAQN